MLLHERQLGGALLAVEELAETGAAQVAETVEIGVGRRDRQLAAVILDAQHDHDLVDRPFGEQLQQRVLVGGSDGGERRLPDVCRRTVDGLRLAEALGPQLREPRGESVQAIAVRHHHDDVLLVSRVGEVEQRAEQVRRVLPQLGIVAAAVHPCGTGEQIVDAHAGERRRETSRPR